MLRHSPELFYAFLGSMLIGAVPSFMPPLSNKQDPDVFWSSHRELFARSGFKHLVLDATDAAMAARPFAKLDIAIIDMHAVGDNDTGNAQLLPALCPDDIAFLQHSSGTTGLKKGVALSHRAVLWQVRTYADSIGLLPSDRIVSWLPLYHDMGLITSFLMPLVMGTELVFIDPHEWVVNPRLLFEAIQRHACTLAWQPNFAFHHLCRTLGGRTTTDLSSMRAWINCSEPCRAETFDLFASTFAAVGVTREALQVCYAMAENVFAVTQTKCGAPPTVIEGTLVDGAFVQATGSNPSNRLFLSTGPALPENQVAIRTQDEADAGEHRLGEVCIKSPCLFAGYHGRPEETAKRFVDGWYKTGDLGFFHGGELYLTGRVSDLIIVHGRNFYAHELEFVINQLPGVHAGRNVAFGYRHTTTGSEEMVIVLERNQVVDDDNALIVRVKQAILNHTGTLPYDVLVVDPGWLVKTTSGKIERGSNENKYRRMILNASHE